jgi:hypothetical protein
MCLKKEVTYQTIGSVIHEEGGNECVTIIDKINHVFEDGAESWSYTTSS